MRQRAQRFPAAAPADWASAAATDRPRQDAAWPGSPWSERSRSFGAKCVVQTLVVTNTSSRRIAGGAHAFADLAFVLVDLRGVDVAIAELDRLLDQAGAGASAQLPGAEPDRGNFCAVGLDELHVAATRTGSSAHYVARRTALPTQGDSRAGSGCRWPSAANTVSGRVRDHREQRARRPARHALALLPVADGLDRHAEPGGEFMLGQARAPAQIAHRRRGAASAARRRCGDGIAGASGNSCPSRNSTIRPSAFSRKRCMFDPVRRHGRRCALRSD